MKNDNRMKSVQLMALAVIAVGGGLIYWQYNMRNDADARLRKLKAETPERATVEADLATSRKDVESFSVELNHLEKGVPTTAYVATLLKELEKLGIDKRMVVTGVRPAPVTASAPPPTTGSGANKATSKPYDELDIDIMGRGQYASIMATVTALQSFPKIVAVKNVSLQPKNDPESKAYNLIDATISIKAYIFKEGDEGVGANVSAVNATSTTAAVK